MLANALRAKLAEQVMTDKNALPSYARAALEILIRQLMTANAEIAVLRQQLIAWHAKSEAGRRSPPRLGLTPQHRSTGGKTRLSGISQQGDIH